MLRFLPKNVNVIDSYKVENTYFTKEEKDGNDSLQDPFPLFQIELTTDLASGDPRYSTSPAEVSQVI